jgi:hypothetical protein
VLFSVGVKLRSLLKLREEHRQRVFKNRLLRRRYQEVGEKCLMKSLTISTPC